MAYASAAAAEADRFRCERRNLVLTRQGCVATWRKATARRPDVWESHAACRGCALGASFAGETLSPVAAACDALALMCPRCGSDDQRLINGRLCVSCYNREREVVLGRNAKGTRPRLLLSRQVAMVAWPSPLRLVAPRAISLAELIVSAAKRAVVPVAFTIPAAEHIPLSGLQYELGL